MNILLVVTSFSQHKTQKLSRSCSVLENYKEMVIVYVHFRVLLLYHVIDGVFCN